MGVTTGIMTTGVTSSQTRPLSKHLRVFTETKA